MISDYLNFDTVGVNIDSNGKPAEIATPQSICNDMTSLFDCKDCNKKLWADLYCKTGNTLIALKQNGVNTSNIIAICENEQSQMFICRKLYGHLLLEEEVELKDDMKPYYKITRRGQVYYICGWKDIVKRNISAAHKLIQTILKEMRETMSLEWVEQDKNFGIDNVIMNPPYNNDMYIDFVELAQNVAKESVVAITPAKWQVKGGEKNDNFRENIVPYMKEIVYYPDCIQVFGISENSGITYFRLDKDVHIKKEICNKAYFQPLINSKIERELNTNDTLWNCGQAIINKIQEKNEKRFRLEHIQEDSRKQYTICVGKQWCGSRLSSGAWDMNTSQIKKEYIGKGGCIFNPNGTIKVLGKVVGLKDDEFDTSNSSICIFTSDNEEEAISFYSFINTKLFSFLILINLKGSIIFDDLTLKYIPDPGAFDHIFTDEELYKKYNLTNEEINIIESVIKDRK